MEEEKAPVGNHNASSFGNSAILHPTQLTGSGGTSSRYRDKFCHFLDETFFLSVSGYLD